MGIVLINDYTILHSAYCIVIILTMIGACNIHKGENKSDYIFSKGQFLMKFGRVETFWQILFHFNFTRNTNANQPGYNKFLPFFHIEPPY